MREKARKVPFCDVEHHPHQDTPGIATHIHKKQLEDALADTRQLRAENAALKAQLGQQAWRRDTPEGDLLIALAEAFQTAHAFADAAPSAQVTDQTKTGRQRPHSTEPKAGNRDARNALSELIRGVESRIRRFKSRQEVAFQRPENLRDVQQACEWCGQGFVAMRSSARFCSDVCRIQAHKALGNAKR